MRVLLDAFWWANGPMANRQVQRELIWHWARQFPQDQLVLAVGTTLAGATPVRLAAAAGLDD